MKKIIIAPMLSAIALTGVAQESGTFFLDVDNASHVIFTQGSETRTDLSDGKNAITYRIWENLCIAPAEGYLIESLTAFDTEGNEAGNSGWWFSAQDDSYSTQFSSYGRDGYTYKVVTREYNPEMYTVFIDIDRPEAVKNNTYTVGNVTAEAMEGETCISFNPDKGDTFTMVMSRGVSDVTLTHNGMEQEGVLNGLDEIVYSFSVSDNDRIMVRTTMESPEFVLELDNPDAVAVTFPDGDSMISDLYAGANAMTYGIGDVLTVKAREGWRISAAEGMRYSSYSNAWTYTFRGGESGKVFSVTTEPYDPPTAQLSIMLEDPSFLKRIVADEVITDFSSGMNVIKINLEKESSCQIVYGVGNVSDVEATIDGEALPVEETWIISSSIDGLEQRAYEITIGSPGWYGQVVGADEVTAASEKITVYTLSGILVKKDADVESVLSLPDGVYVINGKKQSIRN